jgi:hypothetical protein
MRFRDKIGPLHHPILKPANLPDFLTVARNQFVPERRRVIRQQLNRRLEVIHSPINLEELRQRSWMRSMTNTNFSGKAGRVGEGGVGKRLHHRRGYRTVTQKGKVPVKTQHEG